MAEEQPDKLNADADSLAFDDLSRHDLAQDQSDEEGDGYSMEDLRQSYAEVLSEPDAAGTSETSQVEPAQTNIVTEDESQEDAQVTDQVPINPLTIIEALLFVGRPDNSAIPAGEMAALMRGVDVAEIPDLVQQLKCTYADTQRGLTIEEDAHGFRMKIAEELEPVRERFYGRVRTATLNQAAIDCLALIAYQPGVSRQQLEEQRGQSSGPVLSQLVRRQLVEVQRKGTGKQQTLHYYPTEKLLELAGLASLEDLPQVEELD